MSAELPLRELAIKGLTSIADLTLELPTEVTLLVGANGAGKSNLVAALELLGRIVDRQLQSYLARQGGFGSLLHRPADQGLTPTAIELTVWESWKDNLSNGYQAIVSAAAEDEGVVSEHIYFHDRKYPKPYDSFLGTSRESTLRQTVDNGDHRAWYALRVVSGCRVFHFDDVSADAPVKQTADTADNVSLHPDARNLAPVLLRLREEDSQRYAAIVRSVQSVAPFFSDFALIPERHGIRLRWSERGVDGVFSADRLSDGTLRFICLATLLLQPQPPHTIVLDEPELGLHPFAIHQLAELMRSAAAGRRLVAATQSVTLLSHFDISEVAVLDRDAAGTHVTRHDAAAFEQWLGEYSLGEMWEKNLLGGRPRRL